MTDRTTVAIPARDTCSDETVSAWVPLVVMPSASPTGLTRLQRELASVALSTRELWILRAPRQAAERPTSPSGSAGPTMVEPVFTVHERLAAPVDC